MFKSPPYANNRVTSSGVVSTAFTRPPTVVLVCEDILRLKSLRKAVTALNICCYIECFPAFGDAVLRAIIQEPYCLLVDANPNSMLGSTMRRFIAHSLPRCTPLWVDDAQNPDLSELRLALVRLSDQMQ